MCVILANTKNSYLYLENFSKSCNLINTVNVGFLWFLKYGISLALGNEFKDEIKITYTPFSVRFKPNWFKIKLDKKESFDNVLQQSSYVGLLYLLATVIDANSVNVQNFLVYIGDIPIMTDKGTFIINGNERLLLSQLVSNPGITVKTKIFAKYTESYFSIKTENSEIFQIKCKVSTNKSLFFSTTFQFKGKRFNNILIILFCCGISMKNIKIFSIYGNTFLFKHFLNVALLEYEALQDLDKLFLKNSFLFDTALSVEKNKNNLIYIGKLGRKKLNYYFLSLFSCTNFSEYITFLDIIYIIDYIFTFYFFNKKFPENDNSLHLKDVKHLGYLLVNYMDISFKKMKRYMRSYGYVTYGNTLNDCQKLLSGIIRTETFNTTLYQLFVISSSSQWLDQINPLAEIMHKRRITFLDGSNLNALQINNSIRDIKSSYYGNICTVESAEGLKAGLVVSLAKYADISIENEFYFNVIPVLFNKKLLGNYWKKIKLQNQENTYINTSIINIDKQGVFNSKNFYKILYKKQFSTIFKLPNKNSCYNLISANFFTSPTISLLPFIEHDDPTRLMMAAHMYAQAAPLCFSEKCFLSTNVEKEIFNEISTLLVSSTEGLVIYVSSSKIIIRDNFNRNITYILEHLTGSNQGTLKIQKPLVWVGERVNCGQPLCTSEGTENGELALGKNIFIVYASWYGYNYEDSILVNEHLVNSHIFTSFQFKNYNIPLGHITYTENPRVFIESLLYPAFYLKKTSKDSDSLDFYGIVKIGNFVKSGSVLVHTIKSKHFKKPFLNNGIVLESSKDLGNLTKKTFSKLQTYWTSKINSFILPYPTNGIVMGITINADNILIENIDLNFFLDSSLKSLELLAKQLGRKNFSEEKTVNLNIHLLQLQYLKIGDKLCGRHGNKGIVSSIWSSSDMPYTLGGSTADVVISSLGIPSRMNIGQLYECLLSYNSYLSGARNILPVFFKKPSPLYIRQLLYTKLIKNKFSLSNVNLYNPYSPSKQSIIDGRTGLIIGEGATCGISYMFKLIHFVTDKLQARQQGPYINSIEQPVKGRKNKGGQRFGEMEFWALEAFGAVYTMKEFLTIKSDDTLGRYCTFLSGKFNEYGNISFFPESFKHLYAQINALGLRMKFSKIKKGLFTNLNKHNFFSCFNTNKTLYKDTFITNEVTQ
eukprot:GHVL01006008.1.p1 GENE.GHVL01006008.1~~GHVL01006008.1.p1  ORF type:complete len:1162 (+),score=116.78 GHVL01006008.1:3738-7223(+)